jgi:L-tryptophan--pyruvate aminotransferase
VVGNGASQVISSVGYASKALGYDDFSLNAPFWGRLEFLLTVGQKAYDFTNAKPRKTPKKPIFDFVTRPNNPDSSMRGADESFSVVDMCYNWPQYVPQVEKGDYDVMIFSLAKATGHAGTRIGWAVVKDPEVAAIMKDYMELSTCGVSVDSQRKADGVFTRILSLSRFFKSPFDYAKEELSLRWEVFKNGVKDNTDFKLLNQHGMFAFCELSSNDEPVGFMDNKYDLIVTPGRNLGLTSDSNCFRINLGCSEENFTKMMGSLRANKPSITGN